MTKKGSPTLAALGFFLFSLVFCLLIAALCGFSSLIFGKLSVQASVNTENLPTVVIDAGHGGADGGAVGLEGTVIEKEINLDIAKKMQNILTSQGYRVIMTRTEDVMLSDPMITSSKKAGDLSARLKILQSVENAVFISIHMNAFSDSRYSGLQVYYSKNGEESRELAYTLQSRTVSLLQPENTRKIKSAGDSIYLLRKAFCPAVLVECGFLSNPDECARLANEEYRGELANVLCNAIIEYILQNY